VFPIKDNIPTERFPLVTVVLILVNCIVYFFLQSKSGIDFGGNSLDQSSLTHYSAIPYEITHWGKHCDFDPGSGQVACQGQGATSGTPAPQLGTLATVFTAMFSHSGLLHLGGNMLFLWIFGNNVEDSMGRARFLVWYLLAGVAATATQTVVTLASTDAAGASIPNIGASGAIAGVLGAYFVLLPNASVLTFIFFFLREIPAMWFLGIWFVLQLWEGGFAILQPESGGGTAFFAHLGGFVFGLVTVRLVIKRPPLRPAW
jgi:membrane associated rhomboid family serine protease